MADVLIRGMEMPTNCGECAFLRRLEKPILYISPFWCCINGLEVIKQEKNRYCPLVPIPEGHWLTWEEMFPDQNPRRKNNLGVFCSACKKHADNMTDFCPNCGADMREAKANGN